MLVTYNRESHSQIVSGPKGAPMYKLIASDMDETFLDGTHSIPAANVEALRRLRELGVLFVPSSGRPINLSWTTSPMSISRSWKGRYHLVQRRLHQPLRRSLQPLLATTGDRARSSASTHGASSIGKRCTSIPRAERPMCSSSPPEEQEYLKGFPGCIELTIR